MANVDRTSWCLKEGGFPGDVSILPGRWQSLRVLVDRWKDKGEFRKEKREYETAKQEPLVRKSRGTRICGYWLTYEFQTRIPIRKSLNDVFYKIWTLYFTTQIFIINNRSEFKYRGSVG